MTAAVRSTMMVVGAVVSSV